MPFTAISVRRVRKAYRIKSLVEHLRRAGWLTTTEMASLLHVHASTAKRFALEGVLHAVRADDRGQILYEPIHGSLPTALPGKRFRDRRVYPKLAAHMPKEVQSDA
jgi:hypothetical protein